MKIRLLAFLTLAVLVGSAYAQHHAELNPLEEDALRDSAMEPEQRLKLYLKFTHDRLDKLEQVRADPKLTPKDRATATHDRLQDFLDLYDELNDNIDTFIDRKNDIRKPLKAVIEADAEFQKRLKALSDSAAAAKEDVRAYEFVLSSTLDTLNDSATDHQQLLQDQEEMAKHKQFTKQ
jgi:hypothetical protein